MYFWLIFLVIIALVLAVAWKWDRDRKAARSNGDGFGNHSEQRHLEEDHGVTMHGGPAGTAAPATTREGEGSSISYYGTPSGGGHAGGAGGSTF